MATNTEEMKELIKINYDNENIAVSARDLHKFLEVNTPFHKWFPRMCEYGFVENQDYSVTDIFVHHSQGGSQSKKDAIITIDMAKEICMIQRTDRGKQARQYFIQIEKAWNDPSLVMARALKIASTKIQELISKNFLLLQENESYKKQIERLTPAKEYMDTILQSEGCITITQIAADYGISAVKLNHILNEEKIQYRVNGQWILYTKYLGQGYTKSITYEYKRSNGGIGTSITTYWTEKGRHLIWEVLNRKGINPIK